MALEIGQLLHKRYRILEILGQGGMGSVFRAMDENLGMEVAVKENLFTTDEFARQFRLEAVILASLRHANLPRVSDHFIIEDEGQYLIMDFVQGEDLRQRIERIGVLNDEDAILIGAAICDALSYLHSRRPPIIHRDIKPGNIKINPDGNIILVDFGLAKVSDGTQATTIGARAMTPGFSPPEQYGTARTDNRTDIYSLGATLYAALTGVIPEDGLARAMETAQLTPLRKRNSRVSRRLADAINKAMSVDSVDRFQTAEDFKRALLDARPKTLQVPEVITIEPPPKTPIDVGKRPTVPSPLLYYTSPDTDQPFVSPRRKQLMRESRIRRIIIGALLTVILVCYASLSLFFPEVLQTGLRGFFGVGTANAPTSALIDISMPTSTVAPVPIATEQVTLPVSTFSNVPTPIGAESLEIAFASTRSGVSQIYVANLLGKRLRQITDIPEGACQPSWSPDGEKLVFISPCRYKNSSYRDTSLYIVNADGTDLRNLPTVPGGDFEPDWSPDGKQIAFTSIRTGRMQIYIYDLNENKVIQLTETPSGTAARQPMWSPDGKLIAYSYTRYGGIYQIWLMDATGEDKRQFVRSGDSFSDSSPLWSPDGKLILFQQRPVSAFAIPSLLMAPLDSNARPVKINTGSSLVDNVDYSPDGFWLVYESCCDRGIDIYAMTVTGANRTQLTTDASDDFDPVWRPLK